LLPLPTPAVFGSFRGAWRLVSEQVTKFQKSVLLLGFFFYYAPPLDCWNWKLQSFVYNHFQGYRTGSDL
jgi:hypothetical protein